MPVVMVVVGCRLAVAHPYRSYDSGGVVRSLGPMDHIRKLQGGLRKKAVVLLYSRSHFGLRDKF
jgi:hypothetical protein